MIGIRRPVEDGSDRLGWEFGVAVAWDAIWVDKGLMVCIGTHCSQNYAQTYHSNEDSWSYVGLETGG